MTSNAHDATTVGASDIDSLLKFLRTLGERYDHARGEQPASLELARAVLRDVSSLQRFPARPAQVGVVGPTQVGKSTVVNLLLGRNAANVSPLAGFTVRAEGFGAQLASGSIEWLTELLPVAPGATDTWRFETVEHGAFANTVIWDTPDFDSLAAHTYHNEVLNVAAMVDVILLVVSKEKYADLSVWNTLKLLEPLGRPLLVCLNKMTAEARTVVEQSLRDQLAAYAGADIVLLPQHAGLEKLEPSAQPEEVTRLRAQLTRCLDQSNRNNRAAGAGRLLQEHWPDWTAPLDAEHRLADDWQKMIRAECEQALASYRRDYLEHAARYETFRRAVAQLLTLLEIPGLAAPMRTLRGALTWPARQIAAAYRRQRSRVKHDPGEDGESAVLSGVLEQMLRALERELLQRGESGSQPMFDALALRLTREHDALMRQFRAGVVDYQADFHTEIDRAANDLYERLQEQPAVLNSLRVARGLTDATGIAFAIKTGGVGVSDLLFAPAMLSLTSTLTESALGGYMNRVAGELKDKQLNAVRESILDRAVLPRLQALTRELQGAGVFAIDREQLQAATTTLRALAHA